MIRFKKVPFALLVLVDHLQEVFGVGILVTGSVEAHCGRGAAWFFILFRGLIWGLFLKRILTFESALQKLEFQSVLLALSLNRLAAHLCDSLHFVVLPIYCFGWAFHLFSPFVLESLVLAFSLLINVGFKWTILSAALSWQVKRRRRVSEPNIHMFDIKLIKIDLKALALRASLLGNNSVHLLVEVALVLLGSLSEFTHNFSKIFGALWMIGRRLTRASDLKCLVKSLDVDI